MNKEEQKAIESVKSMFCDITIEELIKDKDFKISIYSLGIIDILKVIAIVDNQQKEIKKEKSRIMELAELLDKQENEINSLQQELEVQKGCSISKDKIREKLNKYREKLEKLHSQELWNEPEDSIKDFKYNHYLEAYKELLEEK